MRAAIMAGRRALSAKSILVMAFSVLLLGHMLLKSYMPNVAFGGVGFLLIVLVFSYVLIVRNDVFGFVIIIYICSHFSYADYQGGLWNLIAFGMLVIYKLLGRRTEGFRRSDIPMNILIGVFIIWNVLGWILKNPLPPIPVLQGGAVLVGYILVYYVTSNMEITRDRIRLFFVIMSFMLVYQFLVAINQRYPVLMWNTPLLGSYSDFGTMIHAGIVNTPGTIRHFELFGEYAALMLCLYVPFLSSSSTQRELRFNSNVVVIMIFICLIIPMMTSTRSAALLSGFVILSYYVVFMMKIFSGIDRIGRQLRIILVVGILLPVIGVYVGMRHLEEDFSDISIKQINVENVVKGSSINRGGLTSMALDRIDGESWWVGHGFGIPRSNQWAWFGKDSSFQYVNISDFHSLYLSLPMLYGWVGSLAFLGIIILTLFRVSMAALRNRRRNSALAVLVIGLSMFWFVFMADQYKISIIRNPGYHMLFWVWLGLTHASVRTLRYGRDEPRAVAGVKTQGNQVRHT